MPRSKDFMYIPVPVRVNSSLHQHLKEEAERVLGKRGGMIPLGPYIAALLEDRDRVLYGGEEERNIWFSTSIPPHLSSLVESTVKQVLDSLPSVSWQAPTTHIKMIEEATEEEIEQEASAMAASWLLTGGEDE